MNSTKENAIDSILISVIMPVYNGEKHLREAIDSILAQSFKYFELIIINDGSTDTTEEIILSYNDKRIVYVKNEINLRLIKTLNKGIDLVRGKYIARMDADDIAFPNRFETQIKYFDLYPDVGIVNGKSLYLDSSGKIKNPISFFWKSESAPYIQPFGNTLSHPSVMVLSELLKNDHYRDDNTALHIEDWELWLRLYSKGVKGITPAEPLLYYRLTAGSINRSHKGGQIDNMSNISKTYLKNELGFEIDYGVLRYIMGDRNVPIQLKDVLQVFDSYLIHIRKAFNISEAIAADIELWVYDLCLRDLKNKLNVNKPAFIRDSLFFLTHFNHRNMKKLLSKRG